VSNDDGANLREATVDWVRRLWNLEAEMVEVAIRHRGLTCGYEDPARLGVDRWMALIAARARHRGAICVVDCGTAVTVDAVTRQGAHLGGVIFPGIHLMRLSLAGETGSLPKVEGAAEGQVLGRSTQQCILIGTLLAVASTINSLRSRIEARLGGGSRFFLTGGDGGRLDGHLEGEYTYVPELVLDGLAVVATESPAATLRWPDA
jgi:type III pantothenate kinase